MLLPPSFTVFAFYTRNTDIHDTTDSFFPASLEELQAKVGELPAKMSAGVAEAKEKCVVQ